MDNFCSTKLRIRTHCPQLMERTWRKSRLMLQFVMSAIYVGIQLHTNATTRCVRAYNILIRIRTTYMAARKQAIELPYQTQISFLSSWPNGERIKRIRRRKKGNKIYLSWTYWPAVHSLPMDRRSVLGIGDCGKLLPLILVILHRRVGEEVTTSS